MAVAEWLTKRVEFSLDEGSSWPLVFTHRALFACQDLTGADMLEVLLSEASFSLLRGMIFAALSCAGFQGSLEEVGEAISQITLAEVRKLVFEAWAASMAEPEPPKPGEDPEGKKKVTWTSIWATGNQELGLSDEAWLDMTPRQFRALQKAKIEIYQREEWMMGVLVATFINWSFNVPKQPVSPKDFMLHRLPEVVVPPEELGDHIMRQMAKLTGRNL